MEEKFFLDLIISELEMPNVNLETKFRDLDEWDSLTGMSIILVLEENYKIKISDDIFRSFNTFSDIYLFLKSKQ
ncbi:acyl carrier protein [Flavobacterium plurextorum]|uniref:acyl carrier protein n=1 Tax=Flavobacterium plurextorum TaxID=1114867 RepID=UPI003757D567